MSVLVVYAIVEQAPRALPRGIDGVPLRAVAAGGVTAVAGEHPVAPAIAEAALRAHDAVVRRLAERGPILPARFGQAFADEAALAAELAARGTELRSALEAVRDCVQVTLRIAPRVRAEGGGAEEPAAAGPAAAPASPATSGTDYLTARARVHSPPELRSLRDALRPWVRREILQGADDARLPWRWSLFHLVAIADVPAHAAALESVRPSLAVDVQRSGPWPPYAFAEGALG